MSNARLLLVASVMFLGSSLGRAAEPFVLAEPPKPATPVETANAGSAPCDTSGAACGHGRTCCEKFRAWLFYQPLSRPGPCGCCLPKAPCCAPPLYAFFPCHPGAAPIHDYQADCGQRTSCSHCGWHRKTCACEDQPKPAATGSSELLTAHDESKTAAPVRGGPSRSGRPRTPGDSISSSRPGPMAYGSSAACARRATGCRPMASVEK